jgi:hypothetical protein
MMQFKLKHSYYKASTPEKMRKLGDSIMIAGPVMQGAVMGLPITENTKLWIAFAITCTTVLAKVITNFFMEESTVEQSEPTPEV